MNRPFVNLVVNKLSGGRPAFNLHRIDPARLFSPTRSPKPADPAHIKKAPALGRLPPAAVSLDWLRLWNRIGWMDFMALKEDIIAVDHGSHPPLRWRAWRRLRHQPDGRPHAQLRLPHYTMNVSPGPPPKADYFNALTYGPSFGKCLPEDWYWRPLQPPPLDYDRYEHDPNTPAAHP
ncbi:hypothetical protein ACQ4PT_046166 [Festuca glaucescens]